MGGGFFYGFENYVKFFIWENKFLKLINFNFKSK